MAKPFLTPAHKDHIQQNHLLESGKSMADKFGCDKSIVNRYMRQQCLVVPKEVLIRFRSDAMKGKTTFSKAEDKRIKANYLTVPVKALAHTMGRSYTGIIGRLAAMGLVIPLETIRQRKEDSRIKKGDIPPNKGKRQAEYMSPEAIEKTARTRFQKGDLPHNTKYDGAERVTRDGYIEVRVSKGRYRLKHRVAWEQKHGKIPAQTILSFKDGDRLNVETENLHLITFEENMIRNSGAIHLTDNMVASYLSISSRKPDYALKAELLKHPELIIAKRTELLINRKIKEHGQK